MQEVFVLRGTSVDADGLTVALGFHQHFTMGKNPVHFAEERFPDMLRSIGEVHDGESLEASEHFQGLTVLFRIDGGPGGGFHQAQGGSAEIGDLETFSPSVGGDQRSQLCVLPGFSGLGASAEAQNHQ